MIISKKIMSAHTLFARAFRVRKIMTPTIELNSLWNSGKLTYFRNFCDNSRRERWDLCVAVLVERLPVVSSNFTQMEKEFQSFLWDLEYEKSLKSNHEMRHEFDLKQAEQIQQGQLELDLDELASKQTAQDLEDLYNEEFHRFQFGPRFTIDDQNQNYKSLNRCLDSILYLLIEQKVGTSKQYVLPQGQRKEGENLRHVAERVLSEQCGNSMTVQFLGNAPCGFYKYKYPKNCQPNFKDSLRSNDTRAEAQNINCKAKHSNRDSTSTADGVKLFFYRAILLNGNVDEDIGTSYQWLNKESLKANMINRSYYQVLQKIVM